MTIETPADNGGILSIEQAVAGMEKKEPNSEAPADQPETERVEPEQPEADTEADTTAEDSASEAEEPGDGEEGVEAEAEAIKLTAPKWWNAEQKAAWDELSPKVQAAVYAQEENRERALQKSKQKTDDDVKASSEVRESLRKRVQVLDAILPRAMELYRGKWANVDWAQAAEQMDPADYNRARAQFERDSTEMQELSRQQKQADDERFAEFVREESNKLVEVAPDLADPKQGPERRKQLGKFLTDLKFDPVRINAMSAHEAALAYDAMRWRQAQAKAATAPKNPARSTAPANRPSASAPVRSPQNARIAQLSGKAKLSTEEATELLSLKGGS